mgnify:CR=1 FL=1
MIYLIPRSLAQKVPAQILKVSESSNTVVTTIYSGFNSWGLFRNVLQNSKMFKSSQNIMSRAASHSKLVVLLAFAAMVLAFGENVVSAAGTVHHLTLEQMRSAISELGWEPRRRNVFYELVDDNTDLVLETRPQSTVDIDLPLLTSAT